MTNLLPWMGENPWLTFFLALIASEVVVRGFYYFAKAVQYARGIPDAVCVRRHEDEEETED